jgi:hypothetical protein
VNSPTTFVSSAVATVYTPVYFSFFENIESHIDTTFVEPLSLHCVVNTLAGMGTAVALTAGTFRLFVEYYVLDTDAQNTLVSRNFKPTQPLTMLSYNMQEEITAITASATETTVDLKNNNLVYAMHFFIRDTATGQLNAISDYSLKVSGRTILDTIPSKLSHWQSARRDQSTGGKITQIAKTDSVAGTVENDMTLKPISIYFGMDKSRSWNSGALSFNNVNNPQLTVTHGSGSTDELVVVYEYFQLCSVNSSNGRIDIGLST